MMAEAVTVIELVSMALSLPHVVAAVTLPVQVLVPGGVPATYRVEPLTKPKVAALTGMVLVAVVAPTSAMLTPAALGTAIQDVGGGAAGENTPHRTIEAGNGTPGIGGGTDQGCRNHGHRVGVVAKHQQVVTVRAEHDKVRARHGDGCGYGSGLQ